MTLGYHGRTSTAQLNRSPNAQLGCQRPYLWRAPNLTRCARQANEVSSGHQKPGRQCFPVDGARGADAGAALDAIKLLDATIGVAGGSLCGRHSAIRAKANPGVGRPVLTVNPAIFGPLGG